MSSSRPSQRAETCFTTSLYCVSQKVQYSANYFFLSAFVKLVKQINHHVFHVKANDWLKRSSSFYGCVVYHVTRAAREIHRRIFCAALLF